MVNPAAPCENGHRWNISLDICYDCKRTVEEVYLDKGIRVMLYLDKGVRVMLTPYILYNSCDCGGKHVGTHSTWCSSLEEK